MTVYDIPDVDRVRQMMMHESPVQMQAYIKDLYEGLIVRDTEISISFPPKNKIKMPSIKGHLSAFPVFHR